MIVEPNCKIEIIELTKVMRTRSITGEVWIWGYAKGIFDEDEVYFRFDYQGRVSEDKEKIYTYLKSKAVDELRKINQSKITSKPTLEDLLNDFNM